MKFSVDLHRYESKTVEVFAESLDDAAQLAAEAVPGFAVDAATELLDGDAEGEVHHLVGACEACSARIWQTDSGSDYTSTEDGYFCAKCSAEMESDASQGGA